MSDIMLKGMLHSLRSFLQSDIMSCMQQFKQEIHSMGDRINTIESSISNQALSFNTMVDAHNQHSDDIMWLKDKVADLEDRSRRNNLKLRGVPEAIQTDQLEQYAIRLFSTLVPTLSERDLAIDRIHRLPKPSFLAADTPRDVLLRIHFFQSKEKIMTAFRQASDLPAEYTRLQILPDVSRFTLQKRKNLATITKALRNHKILHMWKHPASLPITYNGATTTITSLEEGVNLLKKWGILPPPADLSPRTPTPLPINDEWQVVSRKRSEKKKLRDNNPSISLPQNHGPQPME